MRLAPVIRTAVLPVAAVALLGAAPGPAVNDPIPAPAVNELAVTIKYEGPGEVNATHRLWIWLFDHPNFGPESMPLAEASIDRNGGTTSFQNLPAVVYIAVAYDEMGGFMGQAAPPAGSPVHVHGGMTGGQPTASPIRLGETKALTVTFDDAMRMP